MSIIGIKDKILHEKIFVTSFPPGNREILGQNLNAEINFPFGMGPKSPTENPVVGKKSPKN